MSGSQFMAEGLCTQIGSDVFYPEPGEDARAAKAVCRACPVQAGCLDYALAHDERFGIWGGTSPRERDHLRRRAGRS